MLTSTERVSTTHAGSLPRPDDLAQLMYDKQDGRDVGAAIDERLPSAVDEIVRRQVDVGIDVVSDGEFGKIGFNTYIGDRLAGFDGTAESLWSFTDFADTPELVADQLPDGGRQMHIPACTGAIGYAGRDELRRDLANLRSAVDAHGASDAFMPAASPGAISQNPNLHYAEYRDYLFAIADAMAEEYREIVEAGFVLQLDAPDLAASSPSHGIFHFTDVVERMGHREFVAMLVEAINRAVADLPPDRMRLHVCWGNWHGTHRFDEPLESFLAEVLEARPAGLLFEAANPRHSHEWRAFEQAGVPDDKVLVPGVIDTVSAFVEHPQVVADRIDRFTRLVGRDRVLAGTDCGFGSYVGFGRIDLPVVVYKLESLVEGARIASGVVA